MLQFLFNPKYWLGVPVCVATLLKYFCSLTFCFLRYISPICWFSWSASCQQGVQTCKLTMLHPLTPLEIFCSSDGWCLSVNLSAAWWRSTCVVFRRFWQRCSGYNCSWSIARWNYLYLWIWTCVVGLISWFLALVTFSFACLCMLNSIMHVWILSIVCREACFENCKYLFILHLTSCEFRDIVLKWVHTLVIAGSW